MDSYRISIYNNNILCYLCLKMLLSPNFVFSCYYFDISQVLGTIGYIYVFLTYRINFFVMFIKHCTTHTNYNTNTVYAYVGMYIP